MLKQQRGIDFPATHFQRGPSPNRAISYFMERVDQALADLGAQLYCKEGKCSAEFKQSCFERRMSQPNSMTVS